jgi:hypothetical protein
MTPLRPPLRLDGVGAGWRRLVRTVFDPYRPELHYMRGPGPKWRARHSSNPGASQG